MESPLNAETRDSPPFQARSRLGKFIRLLWKMNRVYPSKYLWNNRTVFPGFMLTGPQA